MRPFQLHRTARAGAAQIRGIDRRHVTYLLRRLDLPSGARRSALSTRRRRPLFDGWRTMFAAVVRHDDRLLERAKLQRVVALQILPRHGNNVLESLEPHSGRLEAVVARRQSHELELTASVRLHLVFGLSRLVDEHNGDRRNSSPLLVRDPAGERRQSRSARRPRLPSRRTAIRKITARVPREMEPRS